VVTGTTVGIFQHVRLPLRRLRKNEEKEMADLKDKKDIAVAAEGVRMMEFTYDFAEDGGAVGALKLGDLTEDVIIHRAWLKVSTACTSGGSATVSVGLDSGTGAELIGSTAVGSLTEHAVIDEAASPLNVYVAKDDALSINIGTAALTAGKFEVVLEASQID
jgi:hypothetical protein